jgi:hypothetical protein
MPRLFQLLPAAVLGTALSVTLAVAQPPGGDRPRGNDRPPEPRGGDRRGERRPDNQVDAWVKTLAAKITDPHDEIRDSARAGIVAVGEAALPTLKGLADGDDAAKATAAKKLIRAIEGPRPTRTVAGRPPMGGFPGGMGGGFGAFNRVGPDGPPTGGRGSGGFGPMGGGFPGGPGRPDAGPREERRPDGDRRPEGGRPEGERRPEGDRRPNPDRRPDGERRPEGDRPRPNPERD